MTAFEHFSSCILTPVSSSESNVVSASDGKWKTSSFYLDSSGRSGIPLPLQLKCPSKEVLHQLVSTKCLDPFLETNTGEKEDGASAKQSETEAASVTPQREEDYSNNSSSFAIEAKVTLTYGTGEAMAAAVESVHIRSAKIEEESVYFETEIIVRVSRAQGDRIESGDADASRVKTNLEVNAVLSERLADSNASQAAIVAKGLNALNLGGFPDLGQSSRYQRVRQVRVTPFALHVALTHALSISVKSTASPFMGQTFVSLIMRHSNTHSESVTITNIALHPGHSREENTARDKEPRGSGHHHHAVADMSKTVKWKYAPQCDPCLPLTLAPHEAVSTIIVVDCMEDSRSRTFCSPISVTAFVGKKAGDRRSNHHARYSIVAASTVRWTTSRTAIEPADAFRVNMSVKQKEFVVVGAPLTVDLNITNLSTDSKDLMVLVDTGGEAGGFLAEKKKSVKTAVVSEKVGEKFGVWGLIDDGDVEVLDDDADREFLNVDMALLVGEIKASSSKRAELRFIPLREGTLRVPSLKFFDRRRGKWYSAVHNLQVVVQAGN